MKTLQFDCSTVLRRKKSRKGKRKRSQEKVANGGNLDKPKQQKKTASKQSGSQVSQSPSGGKGGSRRSPARPEGRPAQKTQAEDSNSQNSEPHPVRFFNRSSPAEWCMVVLTLIGAAFLFYELEELKKQTVVGSAAQKPWIGVMSAKATLPDATSDTYTVQLKIKNTGTGPAYNWRPLVPPELRRREPGGKACWIPPTYKPAGIFVPQQEYTISASTEITRDELKQIPGDEIGKLFIAGRVDWSDDEAGRQRHCLLICMNYRTGLELFSFARRGHELRHGRDCDKE